MPEKTNSVPVRHELKQSKNGDIIAAARHSGIVISQLTNDEPIREAIRYAMVLIGIRAQNMPQGIEKDILIDFVKRNYGGHSSLEIKIAFDLAVNGTLDIEKVEAFENFSCQYLGKIMSAYRKYAAVEYKQSKIPLIETAGIEESPESLIPVDWSTHWNECVESAKNGQIRDKVIPTMVYDWLEREGKIDKDVYTKEKKWVILKACKDHYRAITADELINPTQSSDKPHVIKYRLFMLNEQDVFSKGELVKKAAWRNDPEIMSHLAIMSKQAIVRELAIMAAKGI